MTGSQPVDKPRLLWIAVKLIDKSVDRTTWLNITKWLERMFDVYFLTGWRDMPLELCVSGRPVLYFPQIGRGIARTITRRLLMGLSISQQILRIKPEVVLLNCISSYRIVRRVLACSKKVGSKSVFDIRTLPTAEFPSGEWKSFGDIVRFAAHNFDGITYITEEMRRYCTEKYSLPPHSSGIWSSGVDPNLFRPVRRGRAKANNSRPFRLIYHGGIISVDRGLDRLIRAIALVRDLGVHLTLISSLREQSAIQWITKLDLQDSVTLMDTIPHQQVPDEINKCDAGILPFPNCDVWNTSSPIKLFEYLSCGKPVIVTNIAAHRSVLEKKPFAFFASSSSPRDLADAIRRAYSFRDTFPKISCLAREEAVRFYTWEAQAKRLADFLLHILKNQ